MVVALLANPVSALSFSFSFTPVTAAAIPDAPAVTPEVTTTVEHQASFVRRSASFHDSVIGRLENGTELKVLSSKGSFYRINLYDMKGYIAKSQVRVTEDGKYFVDCKAGSGETTTMNTRSLQDALTVASTVRTRAMKYRGVPYVWGGSSPRGFDCSGFTQFVMRKAGISISRTVLKQMGEGVVIAKEDLQNGDLVFFSNTTSRGFASSRITSQIIGTPKINPLARAHRPSARASGVIGPLMNCLPVLHPAASLFPFRRKALRECSPQVCSPRDRTCGHA
jgi:cell wall-associated NlpC family hydrolase